MSLDHVITGLVDESGNPITSMGADWTSKAYELGHNLHIGAQLDWSDATITGVLSLEYTNWYPSQNRWITYNAINLDGTLNQALFLDSNLAVYAFRFKYTRISGTATLVSSIVMKRR